MRLIAPLRSMIHKPEVHQDNEQAVVTEIWVNSAWTLIRNSESEDIL